MFSNDQYSLLDFGKGRRLERFGLLILDRPCPSAIGIQQKDPAVWKTADVRFIETNDDNNNGSRRSKALGFRGVWRPISELGKEYFSIERFIDRSKGQEEDKTSSRPWILSFGNDFVLELKGSPFGHVGVFPEQAENWERIRNLCREGRELLGRPLRVLNLFGYTGGSALAAACGGAEVTHLDAARNVVAQAKRNDCLSFGEGAERNAEVGLIRWIVDDAVKFVKREVKRGVLYDGIILDPPTYGHGARGEVWRLSRDLRPLLERCLEILTCQFGFLLLSGHTPNFEAPVLRRMLQELFQEKNVGAKRRLEYLSEQINIKSLEGGRLFAGDLALATWRG